MQNKTSKLVALIAVAAITLGAAMASAVVVKGKGELHAFGNGLAVLEMRGALQLRGIGLLVVEPDVEIVTEGHGQVTELADGRLLYEGFGRARIRSLEERTRVEFAGARIRLHARGVGRAFLKGCGGFRTGDADGSWGPELEVDFESDLEE